MAGRYEKRNDFQPKLSYIVPSVIIAVLALAVIVFAIIQKIETESTPAISADDTAHSYAQDETVSPSISTFPPNEGTSKATELSFRFLDHNMFHQYLTDGTFLCGNDFAPGDYYVMSLYGAEALYDVSNEPNNFSWSSYRIIRKLSVESSQYVKIPTGAILVEADEIDTQNWQKYGVFLVGQDIAPGDYKISTITDTYETELNHIQGIKGAYQINEGSPEGIPIASDYVWGSQEYITLDEGQYITIINAKLTSASTIEAMAETVAPEEAESSISEIPSQVNQDSTPVENNESETYYAYMTAITLTANDLQTEYNDFLGKREYLYKGLSLLSEDVEWIESPLNSDGTVNQGAIYRKVAKLLVGFWYNLPSNDGSTYCTMLTGKEFVSREDISAYITNASEFICTDDSLYHILMKFASLDTVEGSLDFSEGSFHFTITDLTACAEEMMISEEMLGYILAFMDEYAVFFSFDGNSCNIDYDSQFGGLGPT